MASVDDLEHEHQVREGYMQADFPILADPAKDVDEGYGVIRLDRPPEQQLAARWTFYIGPDGRIGAIDKSPTTGTPARSWSRSSKSWA